MVIAFPLLLSFNKKTFGDENIQLAMQSGVLVEKMVPYGYVITTIALSPNQHHLALGIDQGNIWIWKLDPLGLVVQIEQGTPIERLVFSSDGQWLASNEKCKYIGGCSNSVYVWKTTTGELMSQIEGKEAIPVSFGLNRKQLILSNCYSSYNCDIQVWKLGILEKLTYTESIALWTSNDEAISFYNSEGGSISVWDLNMNQKIQVPSKTILNLALSSNGQQLAYLEEVSYNNNLLKVWDVDSKAPISQIELRHRIFNLKISPDARLVASVHSRDDSMPGAALTVWDTKTGEKWIQQEDKFITEIAFHPNGQTIVSSVSNTVRVWNALTGEELAQLEYSESVFSVLFITNQYLAIVGEAGKVKIWDYTVMQQRNPVIEPLQPTESVELPTVLGQRIEQGSSILSISFNPVEKILALGGDNGTVIWDMETNQELIKLDGVTVWSNAFSPDGKRLATLGPQSKYYFMEFGNGQNCK